MKCSRYGWRMTDVHKISLEGHIDTLGYEPWLQGSRFADEIVKCLPVLFFVYPSCPLSWGLIVLEGQAMASEILSHSNHGWIRVGRYGFYVP